MPELPVDILTAKQVAALLKVHPVTVGDWAEKGKLAGFRTPGGRWRFHRADVEALIAVDRPQAESA